MLHSIRDTAPARHFMLAAALTVLLPSLALAGGYKPDPGIKLTNEQAQLQAQEQWQHQSQSQRAYGGQGGNGYGYGGSAASSSTSQANNAGVSQSVNFDDRLQAPAIGVDAPGLAGLAASDCVLSKTWSAGGGVSAAGFGIIATGGTGETSPYAECNTRAAIQVLGQMHGSLQGVDVSVIIGNMATSLTGVQQAIDRAKGKTTQASALVPAATVPTVQTADASAPLCPPNLPKALQMQCEAK